MAIICLLRSLIVFAPQNAKEVPLFYHFHFMFDLSHSPLSLSLLGFNQCKNHIIHSYVFKRTFPALFFPLHILCRHWCFNWKSVLIVALANSSLNRFVNFASTKNIYSLSELSQILMLYACIVIVELRFTGKMMYFFHKQWLMNLKCETFHRILTNE